MFAIKAYEICYGGSGLMYSESICYKNDKESAIEQAIEMSREVIASSVEDEISNKLEKEYGTKESEAFLVALDNALENAIAYEIYEIDEDRMPIDTGEASLSDILEIVGFDSFCEGCCFFEPVATRNAVR